MFLYPRQYVASIVLSLSLLALIIRLVQKRRLDISYCWLWLGIGIMSIVIVVRYDWLLLLSQLIDSRTATTTLFLLGFFVVLLMCLQFSLVITQQRRQIKRLIQDVAILRNESYITDEP